MYWLKGIAVALKMTLVLWKEVFKVMTTGYFKPTDQLVKAQVLLLMMGLHESIEDVPNILNLREAVLIAMGVHTEQPEEEGQ